MHLAFTVRMTRFLCFLPLALGCTHYDVESNGESGALRFGDPGLGGLELAYELPVERFDAQTRRCGIDGCDDPKDRALTFDSASCDDGACDVTSGVDPYGHGFVLRVVAHTTDPRVRVKAHTADGASYTDSFVPRFTEVTALTLGHPSGAANVGSRYGVLVGARFDLAFTVLGGDQELAYAPDAVLTELDSSAFVREPVADGKGATLRAASPGLTRVTFQAAGVSRVVPLQVVNESDVTELHLREAADPDELRGLFDEDPLGADRSSGLQLDASVISAPYALELVTRDGVHAVGGAPSLVIEHANVVSGEAWKYLYNADYGDPAPFADPYLTLEPQVAGSASVSFSVGRASLTVPVEVR